MFNSLLSLFAIAFASFSLTLPVAQAQVSITAPTTVNIAETAKLTTAKRLGIVLGTQDFYDSGQMLRNLASMNPGFEQGYWQSILHCAAVTSTSCTDDNVYTYWPVNFLKGGVAEFIVGAAKGETATVTASSLPIPGAIATTISFAALSVAPKVGDYVVVRLPKPGNAAAGWWTQTLLGATLASETTDISPNSPGKQALQINASGLLQSATVSSYMDSTPGRSFVQLKGQYTLTFRAKGIGGTNQVQVSLGRAVSAPPAVSFFNETIQLTTAWKDYSYTITADDTGRIGTLGLNFALLGSSMLLDDVALTAAAASDNPTVYRNEVVSTLQNLRPGVIRYMDSGNNWGSTIDNVLAADFVRQPTGYSNHSSTVSQIPLSLPDFLVLCQTVGAEPWYTMQTGMSTQEMTNLMDYLGGSTSTVYGAKRAAAGQVAPWTSVFPTIHLEFGNEVWNTENPGASMTDPASYGKRTADIFAAAKASTGYSAKTIDLIMDGFAVVPYWTTTALANATNYNTVDMAAYLFSSLNNTSSVENIFGPMFADPEANDSVSTGMVQQNAAVAAAAKPAANLAVYETNLGTISGSASQAAVTSTVASLGGGLMMADHMLLMMRDDGVVDQNLFALPGLTAPFTPSGGSTASTTPIWGAVIDMGGPTNLVRPTYLGEQLANSAILPTLLNTTQTGANPTWNQPLSTNDNVSLNGAHYLQSFAFTDGDVLNVVLFNLSRTSTLPVTFAGLNAPVGSVTVSTLTASSITANNEAAQGVATTTKTETLAAGGTLTLPAFSMTVVSTGAPVVPVVVTSVSLTCAVASLSPGETTTCTDSMVAQGKYNSAITLTADYGTISSSGVYTAPATVPASGKATITATSVQDTTKKATFAISLGASSVTGVTTSCAATSIAQGATTTCTAAVKGTGSFSTAYTLSASAGSITPAGVLTAPATGTAVVVKATSTQDATKTASTTVDLASKLVITNPTITAVTASTATLSWTVNQLARNGVSWGLTSSVNGGATPYDNNFLLTPKYTITGLTPNTSYDILLVSYNTSGTATLALTLKTSSTSSTISSVSISCPTSVSLTGSIACTAPVTGTGSYSSAVTWSASAGSITSAGNYTAPATGAAVTIKATSAQDATKSASMTVSLTPASTITGISISCLSTTLKLSGTTTCTAPVTGTGTFSSAVTWSASAGTIDSKGDFTAPASGTVVTIKATSTQNPAKSASAVISLNSALAMGAASTSVGSTTATFSWTVTPAARNGVQWGTTSAVSGGSTPYDSNFLTKPSYTITGLKPGTTYYILLTSYNTSGAVFNSFTIKTLASADAISRLSVSCAASSLGLSASTTCTAPVLGTGTYSSAVTWSASAGTIDKNGNFTAPATGTSAVVKATSVQDPTKSASATITLGAKLAMGAASSKVGSTSATFSWTTTIPARAGVQWGATTAVSAGSTPYDNAFHTAPTYTIAGLKPNTTYDVLLTSYDATGAVFTSLKIKTTP